MKIYFILASLFIGAIVHEIVWSYWGIFGTGNMIVADIIGALIPLLTIIFLFKKKVLINTILPELLFLILLGFGIQHATYSVSYYNIGVFNKYLGFTLFLPLFGLFFHSFKIKSKSMIVFISIFIAIIIHFSNFMLYPYTGGVTGNMYGIVFIYGLPIAMLFGVLYALYFIKFYFKEVVET